MPKPIFKSTHYELNKFVYTFKLNQLVRAASIVRENTYSTDRFFRKEMSGKPNKMQAPPQPKTEIKKYVNRPCYPCVAFIRRWKVWLKFTYRAWFYSPPCFYCNVYKEKSREAQTALLFKNLVEEMNRDPNI